MLVGTLLRLAGGLCHLLPDLLIGWHVDVTILVPEKEAILEELLDMYLGGLHCLHLLLHPFELSHSVGNFGLSLLLLELFLLDLSFGLPSGRRGLHEVARLALGDYEVCLN